MEDLVSLIDSKKYTVWFFVVPSIKKNFLEQMLTELKSRKIKPHTRMVFKRKEAYLFQYSPFFLSRETICHWDLPWTQACCSDRRLSCADMQCQGLWVSIFLLENPDWQPSEWEGAEWRDHIGARTESCEFWERALLPVYRDLWT